MSILEEINWEIEKCEAFHISIGNEEYTRFSPESWSRTYGSSEEPVSYPEELERIFQQKLKGKVKRFLGIFSGTPITEYIDRETLLNIIEHLSKTNLEKSKRHAKDLDMLSSGSIG